MRVQSAGVVGAADGTTRSPVCCVGQCAQAQHLDNISHRYIECPVAAGVWAWVGDVWAAVDGGARPPVSVPALLLGDREVWDPGGGEQGRIAWGIIRLAALFFVDRAVSVARETGAHAQPARIVGMLVHYLRRRMAEDYTRATQEPTQYAAVSSSWLPNRPRPSLTDFRSRWARGGVLCRVTPAGLERRLSTAHPAPLPQAV